MNQVLEAIKVLYAPKSSSSEVKDADEFLKKLEKNKESWGITFQILEMPNLETDLYFMAAKILKSKLEYDFGQLTSDEAQILPQKILQILQIHKSNPRSIQSQLVDAFIFLYLHMYEKLPTLLELIQKNFYGDGQMQNYIFLIYEYFPDNVFSKTIVMDSTYKSNMILYFKNHLQRRILEELDSIAKNQNIDQKGQYKLLKIMSNWVDFKTNEEVLPIIANHAVFELALNSMNQCELQEYSANVIISVLRQLKSEENRARYFELFQKIALKVFSYFNECKKAHNERDYDSVILYSKVFVKFGSRAISWFTKETLDAGSESFLINMLEMTNFEEIENEEEMCDFWRNLLSEIKKQQCEIKANLVQRYATLIHRILVIILKKTVFEADLFLLHNEISPAEIDNLNENYENKSKQRFYMRELIAAISELIGAEQVISFLANEIQVNGLLTSQLSEDVIIQKGSELESVFYCLNHVIYTSEKLKRELEEKKKKQEEIFTQEIEAGLLTDKCKQYLFEILSLVLSKEQTWVKFNHTVLSTIIACSEFLQNNISVCQLSFNMIVKYLNDQLLQGIAQSGFEVLCKDCPLFVQEHIEAFRNNVYKNMIFNYQIVAGIAYAVCATDQSIQENLVSLCSPYAADLLSYIKLPIEQQKLPDVYINLKKPLKAIKTIILCVPEREEKGAFPHQLLGEIFLQIWPVLKFLMENLSKENGLIENIISLLKQFIVKMHSDFDVFFTEFLSQIVQLYKTTSHSGILYIIEKCVKIFSNHPQFLTILQSAFEVLVQTTLEQLKTFEDFEENPDIVEDFFGFLGRFVKYFPQIYFSSSHLMNIFNSISIGIKLQHREAAKALFALMELIYQQFLPENINKLQPIENQVLQCQQVLLNPLSYQFNVLLFNQLSEVPSREIREFIFDIFIAQVATFRIHSLEFFQPILQSLEQDIMTATEKEKFYSLIGTSQGGMNDELEDNLVDIFMLIGDRFKKSYRRNGPN